MRSYVAVLCAFPFQIRHASPSSVCQDSLNTQLIIVRRLSIPLLRTFDTVTSPPARISNRMDQDLDACLQDVTMLDIEYSSSAATSAIHIAS